MLSRRINLLLLRPQMWQLPQLTYFRSIPRVICAELSEPFEWKVATLVKQLNAYCDPKADCYIGHHQILYVDPSNESCMSWAQRDRERKALCIDKKYSWPQPTAKLRDDGGVIYYAPTEAYIHHILDRFKN